MLYSTFFGGLRQALKTRTRFFTQDGSLAVRSINIGPLGAHPAGQSFIQWRAVAVSSAFHFVYQLFMPSVQRGQFTHPPLGFRMLAVPFFVLRYYCPDSMQFPVLSE